MSSLGQVTKRLLVGRPYASDRATEQLLPKRIALPVFASDPLLRRLPEGRRTASLLATVRALQVAAVDDALDLLAVLMASKLVAPAERAALQDRLRTLPALRQASVTLAAAGRVLLQLVDAAGGSGGPGASAVDLAAA